MSGEMENEVSVIVPVYNGGEKFLQCIEALSVCDPAPLEVIVVADGESDGVWREAEKYGFRTFRFDKNNGPALARNKGAELAVGNILFFTDADVVVQSDTIGRIVEVYKKYPDISAVIGSYDDQPTEQNFLSQYKNLMNHYVHQAGNEEAFTFWGACGSIRKDVFFDAGMFDVSYGKAMIEDIELGYRLKNRGFKIRLEKTLLVKHLKKWEIKSLLKADIFYRAIPWSELILKEKNLNNDLNLKGENRASALLVFLMLLFALIFFSTGYFSLLIPASILMLLILNRDFYMFYYKKRGGVFALKTIPWHWLYYFYSSISLGFVFVRYKLLGKLKND